MSGTLPAVVVGIGVMVLAGCGDGPSADDETPASATDARRAAEGPRAPHYEVDPTWPKLPLGDRWITGGLGGMCIDGRDHIFVLNRQNVVPEDLDGARPAPPVIELDPEGHVVRGWGDPDRLGPRLHDCHVDSDGNVWIVAAGTGVVQKYSSDGSEPLLQIGEWGRYDSSDGTRDGEPLNSDRAQFFFPAAIDIDAETGEIYVADGELPGGNQRIAVLDRDGRFLRQWRLHRTEAERDITPLLHCLRLSDDGLVYVCDREANRIQVFDREGEFIRNIDVPFEPLTSPEGRPSGTRGTAVVLAFSADPDQRYLFVVNQNSVRIEIVDRETGEVLSSFGEGPGRYPGQLTLPHGIGVDSEGNVYVAEQEGRRIQKFRTLPPSGERRSRPLAARSPAAGPVRFQPRDIAELPRGYAVAVADFNDDGRLDVIANSLALPELAWYENPTWARHVIVADMPRIVNQAMADLDDDGIPEVAFQSAFAMQAVDSEGVNSIASHQGDPEKSWSAERIDRYATSHHLAWADLDGDGRLELVNAPLIGRESLAPTYDQDRASIFWYDQGRWERHTIADDVPGIIHRVRPVRWDPGTRDQILVASFEGIALYRAKGAGEAMTFEKELLSPGHVAEAPRLGASDVGFAMTNGEPLVASVEPWHGNEVVVYTESEGGWDRRVIFDGVTRGHEIAVVDLNGDGRADIVANDNASVTEDDPDATPGVHVFFSPDDPATGEWAYSRVESEAAMNSCVGADLDEDGDPDLVCTGGGGVIRWYENQGPVASPG